MPVRRGSCRRCRCSRHRLQPHERRITKINNITVSHKADLWFISVNYETDMSVCENQATGAVGIDLGVKTLAVCSDGLTVENPRVLRKRERRKKPLQRIVARRRKGSKNRRKAVARLARYEYHTACKRRDWLHKATRTIADENAVCFMEDLNVNGMLKNHRLDKSIATAASTNSNANSHTRHRCGTSTAGIPAVKSAPTAA